MIRKAMILPAAALCLATGGCSDDKAVRLPDNAEVPVGFSISAPQFSRAATVDMSNLSAIGVYGYHTGTERWGWASANIPAALEANYFCNTRLNKSEGWTYSPLRYWPLDPIYKLSFFAYSPYAATADGDGAAIDLSASALAPYPAVASQTGAPSLHYTVPKAIGDQVDLLWATRQDMTAADAPVSFDLKHALVKIVFSAQFADVTEVGKGYSVAVRKITVDGVHGGGTLDLGTGAWSFPGGAQDAEFVMQGSQLSGQTVATGSNAVKYWLSAAAGSLMMIPQGLEDATLVYELEFDNGQGTKTAVPLEFALADLEPWTAGKAIEYKLLIRGEFIRIDTSLWPWETGSDTNIDGNL